MCWRRKSAGTGGHLPAAGGAARPLSDGNRRRLSRPRRRAAHPVRDHRRGGDPCQDRDVGGRADHRATAGAPAAVGDLVVEAILSLVRSARPGPEGGEAGKLIAWGPGPRASQSLMLAVRARALLDGRLAPSIDDVLDLAEPILKHRMALTFAARAEGRTIPDVIRQLKTRIG